ncbi:MAG: enoyl-CoA hydratase/isomerase family protein [Thermomicrobia bacterium]|nr:enoyl-CoA hydratase/isomerase family protein [Thermomicrobia bacterium]
METGTSDVLFERRGPVAWVTFNRPEARNAMTFAMYDALLRVCEHVAATPEIRVLVLTGAGEKAFVAGTDISQFTTFTGAQDALDYEARIGKVITTLETLERPTIAAIRGYAVGGGAALAMVCDIRVATPDARFGFPIARTLGNALAIGAYARLVDLIGPARTKEMIFRARLMDASEAHSVGLFSEIVAPEMLHAHVQEMAEQIAGNAPLTIQITKESVARILTHRRPPHSSELIVKAYTSEDFHEGVSAFLEKRKPNWKGK